MKPNLLIDIGNTRFKWATDSNKAFVPGSLYLSDDFQVQNLFDEEWADLEPASILISSVGNQQLYQEISKAVFTHWGLEAELLISPARGNGITSAYGKPEKLGSDRWAAMVGAYDQLRTAVCVVDCGTAATLDLVTADGLHRGGLIAPGLSLSQQCLQSGTRIDFSPSKLKGSVGYLGQSTEQCIQQGCLEAVLGMINRVYLQTTQTFGDVALVLTGGDAELLLAKLEMETKFIPDLVLRGLAVIQRSRMEATES